MRPSRCNGDGNDVRICLLWLTAIVPIDHTMLINLDIVTNDKELIFLLKGQCCWPRQSHAPELLIYPILGNFGLATKGMNKEYESLHNFCCLIRYFRLIGIFDCRGDSIKHYYCLMRWKTFICSRKWLTELCNVITKLVTSKPKLICHHRAVRIFASIRRN